MVNSLIKNKPDISPEKFSRRSQRPFLMLVTSMILTFNFKEIDSSSPVFFLNQALLLVV
jgi:hypothetical protein